MEVLGQCGMCGRPAHHTCAICGRMVCERHFRQREHLCSECSPSGGPRDEERPWLKR